MRRHIFVFLAAAAMLAVGTVSADAGCKGRRDTGTVVGAVGGGVVGNAATHGSTGGTIAGVVLGGLAGRAIGSSDCGRHYHHRTKHCTYRHGHRRCYWR